MLKGMIGPIKLAPEPDGSLWATYKQLDVAALVRTQVHLVGVTGFEPAPRSKPVAQNKPRAGGAVKEREGGALRAPPIRLLSRS